MSGTIRRGGKAAASTLRSGNPALAAEAAASAEWAAAAAEDRSEDRKHGAVCCGARTRAGSPCRKAAPRGKRRCRLHGDAPGSGAQAGNTNARKHGFYTREAIAERRRLRALLRMMEASL